jgi:hypothetical protein
MNELRGAFRLIASNGIVSRVFVITVLCVCLLFAAVTSASPQPQSQVAKEARQTTQLLKEHPEWPAKVVGWVKEAEVILPKDTQGLGWWLILTAVLAGASAKGLASVAAKNQETLPIPEVLRSVESGVQEPQDADVTVMAPPKARPREKIIVQVLIHTPDNESIARSKALLVEPRSQELASRPLTIQLNMHDAIKVTLDCEEAKIVERAQEIYWNGRYVPVQFQLELPNTEYELVLTPKIYVFVNSILAADTIFRIVVSPDTPDLALSKVDQQGRSYRKRFLSHAREDKAEVMKSRRTLKRLAGGETFMDFLSMDPGEQWESRLEKEIKQCDLFVLFWSRYARASEWVVREAEFAWKCSKEDLSNPRPKMQPYPLEPLEIAGDPPAFLSELHFEDPDLHLILNEERRKHDEYVKAREDEEGEKILMLGGVVLATLGFCLSAFVVANYVVERLL